MGEPYSEEDWRFIAERRLAQWEAEHIAARAYVTDQSKWMIAQLFIVNGGSLAALAASADLRPMLLAHGGWFVAGTALAIACGLGTWAHASMVMILTGEIMDPAVVVDREKWPAVQRPRLRKLKLVFAGSIILGLTSLAAFIGGAWAIAR